MSGYSASGATGPGLPGHPMPTSGKQLISKHPMHSGEESEQSLHYRQEKTKELEWYQNKFKKQQHWDSMESGRKARVEALAKLMGGEKPAKRVNAEVEHKRVGRSAKAALRAYVKWAREEGGDLSKGQRRALSELIAAWNGIRVAGNDLDELDADGLEPRASPPRATLKDLHERVARSGVGAVDIWQRYMTHAKTLLGATDAAGRPRDPDDDDADEADDEAYEDDREWVSIDEANDIMQRRWHETKEKEEREMEEKKRKEAEKHFKKEAEAARLRRLEEAAAPPVLDDDGFVVSRPSRTATPAAVSKPAVLDGYSWTDDAQLLVLYVELSRPVKSNELTVQIGAATLVVSHLGAPVLKRSWSHGVRHAHDDTVWFLEDSGDVVRFELVKEPPRSAADAFWPAAFDGDPYGHGRTTRTDAERYDWRQSEYDVTVTARVPEGTSKFDVSVTLQRDALRVYVKGLGSLVDGVLNRPINLKESTWVLDGTDLTIVLAKLEKKQAWQRLMVGGNEISVHAAYKMMGEEVPEDGPVAYDDMAESEKAYVRMIRELDYAKAAGDDELVAEIEADLDAHNPQLKPDVDRPHRAAYEHEHADDDDETVDAAAGSAAGLLDEKREHADKFGWA